MLGIPIYSDDPVRHDYVVQAQSAFDQTVMGLHQLARWRIPVEIRVVLHRLTVPRLPMLAEYIYRNFPFAVIRTRSDSVDKITPPRSSALPPIDAPNMGDDGHIPPSMSGRRSAFELVFQGIARARAR